jgi:hypothetical protein
MSGQPLITDDPRLTAYALGELDEADRADLERELAVSPELRAELDRIRDVAGLMILALATESREAFTGDFNAPMAAPSPAPSTITRRSRGGWFLVPAAAAMIVAAFLLLHSFPSAGGNPLATHFNRHRGRALVVTDFSDQTSFFEYVDGAGLETLSQQQQNWSSVRFARRKSGIDPFGTATLEDLEAKDAPAPAQAADAQESSPPADRYYQAPALTSRGMDLRLGRVDDSLGINGPVTGSGLMKGAEAKPEAEGLPAAIGLSLHAVPRFDDEAARRKVSEDRLGEIAPDTNGTLSFSVLDGSLPKLLKEQIAPLSEDSDFSTNGISHGWADSRASQKWGFDTNGRDVNFLYADIDQDALTLNAASKSGKYSDLRAIFRSSRDEQSYGRSYEYGRWDGREYHGQKGLPTGFWVYLAPDWYIWGRRGADVAR